VLREKLEEKTLLLDVRQKAMAVYFTRARMLAML